MILESLSVVDPYIRPLGLTREQFLQVLFFLVGLFVFFVFYDRMRAAKESVKAKLRSWLQGWLVKSHVSKDGQTLETSENHSLLTRLVAALDNMLLAPDGEVLEGFTNDDDDDSASEEEFEEEEEEEDENENENEEEDEEEGDDEGNEGDDEEDEEEEDVEEVEIPS
jgi:phosphopantothenoylcysteine synthetase/decarboxylase